MNTVTLKFSVSFKIGKIFDEDRKVDSSFLDSNYSSVTPVDLAITRDCWKTYRAERKINN